VEYLLHFIFTLLKISVLAWAYAEALRFCIILCTTLSPGSPLARFNAHSKQFRWGSRLGIAFVLFTFSFTYWGEHGLGDYARIPLGNGEAMQEINGMEAYFEADVPLKLSSDQPFIDSFQVTDDVLCGQANDKTFFTYDLVTKQQRHFDDAHEYATYAAQHSLPAVSEFKSFSSHYSRYWGGWRFWLLA
jgi:hypothetical protein